MAILSVGILNAEPKFGTIFQKFNPQHLEKINSDHIAGLAVGGTAIFGLFNAYKAYNLNEEINNTKDKFANAPFSSDTENQSLDSLINKENRLKEQYDKHKALCIYTFGACTIFGAGYLLGRFSKL